MNRAFLTLATVLAASAWAGPIRADDGGYVDPQTGLVWSQSQAWETGSWWTWGSAQTRAADYAVWDLDEFGQLTHYAD